MARRRSVKRHSTARSASKGHDRIHQTMKAHKRGKPVSSTAQKPAKVFKAGN